MVFTDKHNEMADLLHCMSGIAMLNDSLREIRDTGCDTPAGFDTVLLDALIYLVQYGRMVNNCSCCNGVNNGK